MSPEKEAMIVEQETLMVKTAALHKFIYTNLAFYLIEENERSLMVSQLGHMEKYLDVLTARIKAAS